MNHKKLILINHYASIPRWPGPTRNFDFAAHLTEAGWVVNLFSCRFNHYLRSYLKKPPRNERGVHLKWVWSTPYQGNSIARELNIFGFSFISFWQGLLNRADVVVTVTPPLESAFSAWLMARIKGIPFILDVEDLWPDSIIAMGFSNKLVIKWLRFLERFLYRHSDHILVVAEEMKNYLLKQGVLESRITVIPLGANIPEKISPEKRAQVRNQYGWKIDQIIAVYVGAHGPANALETLVNAAKTLPENSLIQIVLFGDGSDKPRLQKLVQDTNISRITLEDSIPPAMVPEILQAADIGIASLKDTDTFKTVRPNKLYEYMAAGLPILCCIDGEAAKFVKEIGSGITIKPEDYSGLADQLQQLAINPQERQLMGDKGLEFVNFSGDRAQLAIQMGEVIQKVIGENEA